MVGTFWVHQCFTNSQRAVHTLATHHALLMTYVCFSDLLHIWLKFHACVVDRKLLPGKSAFKLCFNLTAAKQIFFSMLTLDHIIQTAVEWSAPQGRRAEKCLLNPSSAMSAFSCQNAVMHHTHTLNPKLLIVNDVLYLAFLPLTGSFAVHWSADVCPEMLSCPLIWNNAPNQSLFLSVCKAEGSVGSWQDLSYTQWINLGV